MPVSNPCINILNKENLIFIFQFGLFGIIIATIIIAIYFD